MLAIDSEALQNGGNDWIYGNVDRDVLVGGTGDDAIDGGLENDLLFGDNVSLVRTYHDTTSLRFQALCGSLLYSRSDEPNPCGGSVNADNSGALLVDNVPQAFRDPFDVPWWAELRSQRSRTSTGGIPGRASANAIVQPASATEIVETLSGTA